VQYYWQRKIQVRGPSICLLDKLCAGINQKQFLEIIFVASEENIAEIFTNNLDLKNFPFFQSKILNRLFGFDLIQTGRISKTVLV
jgi:hypothetical protein